MHSMPPFSCGSAGVQNALLVAAYQAAKAPPML
jgi:hypothetical protein